MHSRRRKFHGHHKCAQGERDKGAERCIIIVIINIIINIIIIVVVVIADQESQTFPHKWTPRDPPWTTTSSNVYIVQYFPKYRNTIR